MKKKHAILLSALLSAGIGYLIYSRYNKKDIEGNNDGDDNKVKDRYKKTRHLDSWAKHIHQD